MSIQTLHDTATANGAPESTIHYDGFNFELTEADGTVNEFQATETDKGFRVSIAYHDGTVDVRNQISEAEAETMLLDLLGGKWTA